MNIIDLTSNVSRESSLQEVLDLKVQVQELQNKIDELELDSKSELFVVNK